jgi:hypothetical protein
VGRRSASNAGGLFRAKCGATFSLDREFDYSSSEQIVAYAVGGIFRRKFVPEFDHEINYHEVLIIEERERGGKKKIRSERKKKKGGWLFFS